MPSTHVQLLKFEFIAPHKSTGLAARTACARNLPPNLRYARFLIVSNLRDDRHIFLGNKTWGSSCGLQSLMPSNFNVWRIKSSADTGPPMPSDNSSGSWKAWIIGMIITIILPFWRNKWGPLLNFKQKVDTTIDGVKEVAAVVEQVAEEMEKVAEEVADHVPQGKLHAAAEVVETIAKETAKGAKKIEETFDKVEEVEKEFIKDVEDEVGLLSAIIPEQQKERKIDGDAEELEKQEDNGTSSNKL